MYVGWFFSPSTWDMKTIPLKTHPEGDDDDPPPSSPTKKITPAAAVPATFWFSELEAVVPMDNLVFTLDFGGNPAGVEVTVENFVIKDHANDDGTVLPDLPSTTEPEWADVNSADNLWAGCPFTN